MMHYMVFQQGNVFLEDESLQILNCEVLFNL